MTSTRTTTMTTTGTPRTWRCRPVCPRRLLLLLSAGAFLLLLALALALAVPDGVAAASEAAPSSGSTKTFLPPPASPSLLSAASIPDSPSARQPKSSKARLPPPTTPSSSFATAHRSSERDGGQARDTASKTVGDASKKKQGAYGKVRVHKESTISQLLRLDEVLAAFALLYINPLQSNLERSNYIQQRYPRDDVDFCNDMLVKVSRSFAAVIQQLPETLLVDIMVFYLVLRALDTIEDDTSVEPRLKIQMLNEFANNALLNNPDGRWSVDGIGEGDELLLLQQFSRVYRVYDRLPIHSQQVIVDITDRMAKGMAMYVTQDFRQGTANMDEYNLYCHYVAGLVGEGLSRLFAASQLEPDPVFGSSDQHLSNQMGLFLQKTNIIRDYLEDYVDGRAFWPQTVWKQYSDSGDLGCFVLQHDPYVRKQSLRCLNELVTDALELVPDCLLYMGKLRCQEIFRFCAIPQVMAIATLEKCFGSSDVFTGVVKIRKGLSCKLIGTSSTSLSHVHEAFYDFANRIVAKARQSMAVDDPVRERTLRACSAIAELTQARTVQVRRVRTFSKIAYVLLVLALITPSTLDRNLCLVTASILWGAARIIANRQREGTNPLIKASVLETQLDAQAAAAAPYAA